MNVRMRRVSAVLLVILMLVSGDAMARGPRHKVRPGPLPPRIASKALPRVSMPLGLPAAQVSAQGIHALDPRTMRVLVISADGSEPAFAALKAMLDQIGIPYTPYVVLTDGPLTADKLAVGSTANYYAVMLATSNLAYWNGSAWVSAFTPVEWQILWTFESEFLVRQVTFYTYPTAAEGFDPPSAQGEIPTTGQLTPEGQVIFPYLKPTVQIPVKNAWTYFATANGSTPLIVTSGGSALAAVKVDADGRENLAFTMDNNPYLLHSRLIAYGAINWVTKGLYLGQRRVFLNPHVDDIFIDDDVYFGDVFRMSASDFTAAVSWQNAVRLLPLSLAFRLAFPYNGEGTTTPGDPLVSAAVANQRRFEWISHTYSHPNLDSFTQAQTSLELQQNHQVAVNLGFSVYSRMDLVTPDVSGLSNPAAMAAAKAEGVRNVISDASIPSQDNPSFNTGIPNALEPTILQIPRYPTNWFYNVTEPAELLAEFGVVHPTFCTQFPAYCPSGSVTYDSLVDFESEVLLGYLLTYDLNPLMFHQTNLRQYVAGRSLLADLINAVIGKYEVLFTLPIRNLTMNRIGTEMRRRADFNAAGLKGTLLPGQSLTVTATTGAARVPITGVTFGSGSDTYGSQITSFVSLKKGQTVVIPLPP